MKTIEIMEQKIKEDQNKAAVVGSLDPGTLGHLDMIISFMEAFPQMILYVIVAFNEEKKYVFSVEERIYLLEKMIPEKYKNRIKIVVENGIVVHYLRRQGITKLVKGVRNAEDYRYEMDIADVNILLNKKVQPLFIPQTNAILRQVSSSSLKNGIRMNIDMSAYAPALTREAVRLRLKNQLLVGVTGEAASGKSTIAQAIAEFSRREGLKGDVPIHYLELDKYGKMIYSTFPEFMETRYWVVKMFDESILNEDTSIDTYKLGTLAFENREKLNKLTELVLPDILFLMNEDLNKIGQAIILVEGANIVENNLTHLFDENLIVVSVPPEKQIERMRQRNYTPEQIRRRMEFQLTSAQRIATIKEIQSKGFDRFLMEIDGTKVVDSEYADWNMSETREGRSDTIVIQNLYGLLQDQYKRRMRVIR